MSSLLKPGNSGADAETPRFDADHLYRQETYTDLSFGSIQVLTPVKSDGSPDAGRKPVFMGNANLLTPRGAIPVQCDIPAGSLKEAIERFPAAIERGIEEMVQRAREIERERAGGIVVPAPGSRIQMP